MTPLSRAWGDKRIGPGLGSPVPPPSWEPEPMARKPRDYDAELQALMERARKVKTQKTTQLGELVQVVGVVSPGVV